MMIVYNYLEKSFMSSKNPQFILRSKLHLIISLKSTGESKKKKRGGVANLKIKASLNKTCVIIKN